MTFVIRIILSISINIGLFLSSPVLAIENDVGKSVVLAQIQTGTSSSASQEFISVYNNSNQPAEVTNWCVVYSSSSDITQTSLGCLKPPEGVKLLLPGYSSFTLATLELGGLQPSHTPDVVFKAGIAATSGHLKLLDSQKNIIDIVGWGSAVHPEGKAATAHATDKILQRIKVADNLLQDLNNNELDFYQTQLVLPARGNVYEEVIPVLEQPVAPNGLRVTELLADVTGADAGKEFIELFNSSDLSMNLKGYILQLGPGYTKSYTLPDLLLRSESYIVFTDTQSGMVLPNTSASVRLLAPDGSLIQETDTYNNPGEDVSWAYISESWHRTHSPTPGSDNIILQDKPCGEAQIRNLETGLCSRISVVSASLLAACKIGQTRSPDTNRCRNTLGLLGASTAACKPSQIRNPDTGRCRNATTAAIAKSCPVGQIRNAETNRCRKATDTSAAIMKGVKDVPSPLLNNNIKWWLAGIAAAGSVAYAAYEWRREVVGFTVNLKNKLLPS